MRGETPVGRVHATALRVPTDGPEADGTLAWDSTVIVLVNVEAGGMTGLGYTYGAAEAASLINATLAPTLAGKDIWDIPFAHQSMRRQVRNMGASGIAATAISAVDIALWDLKARLLDLPLVRLLGMRRSAVPVYGRGGFTNYDNARLRDQLAGWVGQGCRWVTIKVGTDPDRDPQRMAAARDAIGEAGLFIDANGALSRRQAVDMTERGVDAGMRWFEDPVSGDDLAGLRWLRDQMPASIEVAAGEYAWNLDDIRLMLDAGAVDVQRPMPPAAAASPDSWQPGPFARPITSICPDIVRLRCIATSPARCHGCATSNTSMTMPGWRHCCSTVLPRSAMA
jgi:L-alanine-DL-glutamate epimerase-like enolase superfamily enzyme